MFNECIELKYLNLSNFNTSKVTDLSIMFQECFELEYIDISNFNTANVKNMGWMFNKCYKLKEIKGINILNNAKGINKSGIFDDCPKLKDIPNDGGYDRPKQIEKKQITITFTSLNQKINNYLVTCYNTDIFETIKEKMLNNYPEFKHKEIYFMCGGNVVNERVSLAENNIKDGTGILVNILD